MRRPRFIAEQSRHPRGWLGRLIATLMVRETAVANDAVLAALGLTATDRVLDVGCGPGRTLARAAAVAVRGHAAGVDVSAEMLRRAARQCRALIADGRVELCRADAATLPYAAASFDKILSVHTLYFWSDPLRVFSELLRVLAPGGRLALGFRSNADAGFVADFPASVYRFHSEEQVCGQLFDTGFARTARARSVDGVVIVTAERARGAV